MRNIAVDVSFQAFLTFFTPQFVRDVDLMYQIDTAAHQAPCSPAGSRKVASLKVRHRGSAQSSIYSALFRIGTGQSSLPRKAGQDRRRLKLESAEIDLYSQKVTGERYVGMQRPTVMFDFTIALLSLSTAAVLVSTEATRKLRSHECNAPSKVFHQPFYILCHRAFM